MHPRPMHLLLVLLIATPLAAASQPAPQTIWTVYTTVQAEVRESYATVKVIEEIANRGPDPEFPFVVRVPDDAFVTGLTLERDGQVHEALVEDRAVARAQYESWKAKEQTGGLVEKTRRTNVYSYLINVAEFTNVRATLTYERYLAADRGVHNLSLEAPVPGFGRDLGARFEVRVHHDDGMAALWGEPNGRVSGGTLTYEVGPRPGVEAPTPFTASYMLAPTDDAGSLLTTIRNGTGYFAHRFRASQDAEALPLDLVLVLDVSGSMAGLKLQQMVDAAKEVVRSLGPDDRLHLVAFSSSARSAWDGLIPMSAQERLRAAREIDALFDGGGTNIEAGLRRGFEAIDAIDWAREEERFPALVLLTDGQPTAGLTSRDELRALAQRANEHDVNVFGIAFGDDADWALIRTLATDGDGAAIRVPLGQGAEVDLRRFMAALTTPVLRDVRIVYSEGVVAHRASAPVLFAGSELLVTGTYDPAKGISGQVTGLSTEGERRYTFSGGQPEALPFLPRLVAYHEVRGLQGSESPDVARIKALALEHSFVTDHTSLVLTLPAREVRPFVAQDGPRTSPDASGAGAPSSASSAPSSSAQSGGSWWPFSGRSVASNDAPVAYEADAQDWPVDHVPPGETPPAPRVPGPGVALVLLAAGAMALAMGRKRRSS